MLYNEHQSPTTREQGHPLYAIDRAIVDRLLSHLQPEAQDIADAARLFTRYTNYPGCHDIQQDLRSVLRIWGITHSELNDSARSLWRSGWRPQFDDAADAVGSGADVTVA